LVGEVMIGDSERRFTDAINAITDVFYALDPQWRIVAFNAAAQTYFGFPAEAVLGKSLWDVFPQGRGTPFGAALEAAMRRRERSTLDARSVLNPGKFVTLVVAPWDDGVCVVVRDVTAQSKTERRLEASEERLRLATEAAAIGTWDFNPATGKLQWNDRCKALFGLSPEAEVDYETTFLAGLHPDDRERVHAAVQGALTPGGSPEYDTEYRTIGLQDGVERWIAAKGKAIFRDGRAVRFIGTVLDITARKQAERRLEIVNRTGAAVAAELELEKIVQIVTDAGVELTGAQFGAFFYNVVKDKDESYRLYTLSGAPRSAFENFLMPRNTAVFAPTFAGEGVVRSDDIRLDPRYGKNAPRKGMPKGHLPVASYLAVPVVSRSGEVLGGLFFGHEAPGRFDEASETLVATVANQAAAAIDNARLYASTREAQAKLAAVNETLEAVVAEEVAARVSAERGAHAASEQFRLLVHGVVDYAICLLDLEGTISTWNTGAERIKGYAADEIIGKNFSIFYTDDAISAGEPRRFLDEAREHGRTAMEGWRVKKDGSAFWASVVIDAVRDPQGNLIGFAKITRDITAQREAARELEAAREALFQAQKMESIGQLTGGVAHDFNNMLAVIIGGLNLMQRRLDRGDVNVGKYVAAALEGAQRASALTQRLLAFSRRQPLEPTPVDANKLVSSMTEMLARTLGEHIQVETVLGAGLWRCHVDRVQLESSILNLAVNARDAMPGGGKLTIDTANALVDAKVARDYGLPEGQYVLIAVSDTGEGMTADVMAQAFDPFFTTKSVGKGSGLGLSQVFGFVRQSGGHVKLYSEVGVGTTVKLYLPRYTGPEGQQGPETTSELSMGDGSETVLVVEDEERVRHYSSEALAELGYSVIAAETPRHALELIESGRRIDLLFTDVVMPEMNGRQLAEKALQLAPKLKVLFTTGYTRNAIVHNGVLDPSIAVLQKPFTVDELAAKVRQVLDK
jgi:PAS domain S-box-containing protein